LRNAIVTVPINPEFGSLNLAQAVILLAYEWSKRVGPALQHEELEDPAPHGEVEGLIASSRRAGRQGIFPSALAD
jgi:tRNA/rRNA methyltransferase